MGLNQVHNKKKSMKNTPDMLLLGSHWGDGKYRTPENNRISEKVKLSKNWDIMEWNAESTGDNLWMTKEQEGLNQYVKYEQGSPDIIYDQLVL